MTSNRLPLCVYLGQALQRYNFGEDHPFGPFRHAAFAEALEGLELGQAVKICPPQAAEEDQIEWFHAPAHVARVKALSESGSGYLDLGDTPAVPGIYDAAATVVGTVLAALDAVLEGRCRRAFVPIAGLHHARRDRAAGFCVFNDCGVAIEALRRKGIRRVAYVDIDAHHSDGVFYGFEADPELFYVDFHEDGRFLYPGTGFATETGKGKAQGSKLNIPMRPGADDADFLAAWEKAERFIRDATPEFILFQCGADSLAGDPLTDLEYSEKVHAHVAEALCRIADESCGGRIVALGGGGYDLDNITRAWAAVVQAFAR